MPKIMINNVNPVEEIEIYKIMGTVCVQISSMIILIMRCAKNVELNAHYVLGIMNARNVLTIKMGKKNKLHLEYQN